MPADKVPRIVPISTETARWWHPGAVVAEDGLTTPPREVLMATLPEPKLDGI